MTKLAIKGHPTRGKDVIEILEMLGGKNDGSYRCDLAEYVYSINGQGIIDWYIPHPNSPFVIFTLEKFLEKFPYKVGDKVNYVKYNDESEYTIQKMRWTGTTIEYTLDSFGFTCLTKDIRLHKENNMNNFKSLNVETYLKVWDETEKGLEVLVNDRFELKEDNGKFYIVKKQPEYPKTFVECAKMLDCFGAAHIDGYKCELLESLQELLVCRNAYWKIAGEQMELDKPWEPAIQDTIWGITRSKDEVEKYSCHYGKTNLLEFPTEEIRDTFYENFKNLIEVCKEFL